MDFASDNHAGIAPEILAAIAAANDGPANSYGDDPWTERVQRRIDDIFDRPTRCFPVLTGGAANCLALSTLTPPYGLIFCHQDAHIETSECAGPEFFTGGARLKLVGGADGKIDPALFDAAVKAGRPDVHGPPAAALSLTQATEWGTLYRPDEIAVLTGIAHAHGIAVHMDGARFANAVASLGCAPADLTWRAGVDVLSFGATKNGAMLAEAVVYFDHALVRDFEYRRKRSQQLLSKLRFVSAQLDRYLDGGLWLDLARRSNAMAARLARGLGTLPDAALAAPVEANEIFVTLPARVVTALEQAGAVFYRWDEGAPGMIRLVTSFSTTPEEVDRFLGIAEAAYG